VVGLREYRDIVAQKVTILGSEVCRPKVRYHWIARQQAAEPV
jgi:hypothetical protein